MSARELATEDSTAVFASWNGATEVASWRVLAGAGPGSLTAQVTMPDSGFESTVTFPNSEPYVAVQALGAAGQLLGTSEPVKVRRGSEQRRRCPRPAAPPLKAVRGAGEAAGAERHALLLTVCCLAQFMVILDVSIVNVALPSIHRSLGFTAPICSGSSTPTRSRSPVF